MSDHDFTLQLPVREMDPPQMCTINSESENEVDRQEMMKAKDYSGHRAFVNRRRVELWSCVETTVMKMAKDAGFDEMYAGEAFSLMQPGRCVHVPRKLVNHKLEFDYKYATLDHQRDFDVFPGATCVYPMSKYQWHGTLSAWVMEAGFDIADVLSDTQLCFALFFEVPYEAVPTWLRFTFVGVSSVSLVLELLTAWHEVHIQDKVWLNRLRQRHGCWHFMKAWVSAVFLRYLSIPIKLEDASLFFSPPEISHSTLCRDCGGANIGKHPDIPAWVSEAKVADEYADVRSFIVKLPRVFLEDFVLFALTVIMLVKYMHEGTVITWVKVVLSGWSLCSSLQCAWVYAMALKRYRNYLVSCAEEGDRFRSAKARLNTLDINWARKMVLWCCCATRTKTSKE